MSAKYSYVHVLDKSLYFAVIQLFLAYVCLGSANYAGANINNLTSYRLAINSLALYLVLGFLWIVLSAWILYHKYGKRGLIVGLTVNFIFYYLLWSMYASVIAQNPNTPAIERLAYVTEGEVMDDRVRPKDAARLSQELGGVNPKSAYATSSYERMGKVTPQNTFFTSASSYEGMGQIPDNLSSVGPVDGSVLPGSGNWLPYLHNGTSEIIAPDVNPRNYNLNLNYPLATQNSPDPDFASLVGGQGPL
jgi:hypothetical protein